MPLPTSSGVRPRSSARRLALGAFAIVAIGGVALGTAPQMSQAATTATTVAPAGPASFADVVDRVKGAVVSVKVKNFRRQRRAVGTARPFSRDSSSYFCVNAMFPGKCTKQ